MVTGVRGWVVNEQASWPGFPDHDAAQMSMSMIGG